MDQECCQTSKLQSIVRPIINSTIYLTRTKPVPWISKYLRASKVSRAIKCTRVDFTCRQYSLDKINRKTIASNYLMHREHKEHQVANKMQNRLGTIPRAWTMQCLTVMSKTKIDICRFNNSNKIEKQITDLVDNRNNSLWAQLLTWATCKTSLESVVKTSIWTQWTFSNKRPSFTNHPLLALQVIWQVQLEALEMEQTTTSMELLDQPITCNRQIIPIW